MNLKHILSTKQFLDKNVIRDIFRIADSFKKANTINKVPQILTNKILACVFYEPSTRTRFSFESAMLKLGGEVISTESASQFSSATKGETLEDSIRVIGGYANAIVLRHPDSGSAQKASAVSSVPIINAGDGTGEHPTQALLDLYTIKKELGRLDNLTIGMIGDLLNGRTIHSLIHLLSLYNNITIYLISPQELKLPNKYKEILKKNKIKFIETDGLEKTLSKLDVVYMTRVQKERFSSLKLYEKVKNVFILNKKSLQKLPPKSIIMHPLPRTSEINPEIDTDSRSAYFRQAQNGLYIRMALLSIILK